MICKMAVRSAPHSCQPSFWHWLWKCPQEILAASEPSRHQLLPQHMRTKQLPDQLLASSGAGKRRNPKHAVLWYSAATCVQGVPS